MKTCNNCKWQRFGMCFRKLSRTIEGINNCHLYIPKKEQNIIDVDSIEIGISTPYESIFKLHEALNIANIDHQFVSRSDFGVGYQIVVLKADGSRLVSVIESEYSYGGDNDLLEIMGLLTEEESECDDVVGYLTAQNVFNRIYLSVK